MSQPDMHPEGGPREGNPRDNGTGRLGRRPREARGGHGDGLDGWEPPNGLTGADRLDAPDGDGLDGRAGLAAPWGPWGRHRWPGQRERGDLGGAPFPLGDWGKPAARLDELYRWAEEDALRTAAWYLADRRRKRTGARALRAGAALGVAAGAGLPLLELAGVGGGLARWGYLGLLLAGVCLGLDRLFGLSSGWMRDVATAQAVLRRLAALRFEWATESVREVLGPAEGTASEAAERCLTVLRRFTEDVSELVRGETAEWMVEFRAGPGPLHIQSLVGRVPRGETGPPPGRSAPPGGRPSMPRQRPPEGPY